MFVALMGAAPTNATPVEKPPFALNRESFLQYMNRYYSSQSFSAAIRFISLSSNCRYKEGSNTYECLALNAHDLNWLEIRDPSGTSTCATVSVSWQGDFMRQDYDDNSFSWDSVTKTYDIRPIGDPYLVRGKGPHYYEKLISCRTF